MTVHTQTIALESRGDGDMIDITDAVARVVSNSGLVDGMVCVFCQSATSAVTTIEYEPGALADFKRLFDEVANSDRPYAHSARWGDGNGHSHVRAALLGPSLAVPIVRGRLTLGTWQQIVFVDFDNRPRLRNLIVQLIGE